MLTLSRTLCVIIVLSFSTKGFADLMISPTRVNFDNRDRVKEVILINSANETRTYRMGWKEYKANSDGTYVDLVEGDNAVSPLSSFIRFSPRQVTLRPGEKQVIKLQLRKKSTMVESEYRSHLLFQVLPPNDMPSDDASAEGTKLQLNMLLSYSIPVLYHPSKPKVSLNMTYQGIEPRLDDAAELWLRIYRDGNASAHGRIEVYADINGIEKQIGIANGVSVFKENDFADRKVILPNFKGIQQTLSNIRVVFKGEKEYAGQVFFDARAQI